MIHLQANVMNKEKILLLLTERKKLLLLITAVFLLSAFFLYFLLSRTKKDSLTEKKSFPSPTPISPSFDLTDQPAGVKIGRDSFSDKDFEYLASVYLPSQDPNKLTAEDRKYLDDLALERSIVIQETQKRNLILVDPSLLVPNKNWEEYNRTYEKAKEAIISQEEQLSVTGIFMFFYNQFPPKMGVEKAKELTRKKMEELRGKLIMGKINLQQAAEIIANDSSLAEIDPIYDANAYSEFNKRNKTRQIVGGITAKDDELLWSLNVGDYSPIILGYESGNEVTPNEAYWAIFQVTSKTGTGKPYLEWLKEQKRKYAVQNL